MNRKDKIYKRGGKEQNINKEARQNKTYCTNNTIEGIVWGKYNHKKE
jgi:hypothetical protein